MIVNLSCAPDSVNVPVLEPRCRRMSTCPAPALVATMWTLLAALRAAAASSSTSAGDFFSNPLVVMPLVAVVRLVVGAPPQAVVARVTGAAIAIAAVKAKAGRMRFIEIPLAGGRAPVSRLSMRLVTGREQEACSEELRA